MPSSVAQHRERLSLSCRNLVVPCLRHLEWSLCSVMLLHHTLIMLDPPTPFARAPRCTVTLCQGGGESRHQLWRVGARWERVICTTTTLRPTLQTGKRYYHRSRYAFGKQPAGLSAMRSPLGARQTTKLRASELGIKLWKHRTRNASAEYF